jgi:hypothetical protein
MTDPNPNIFYAIRTKDTGQYLPTWGRGATAQEHVVYGVPRLYTTKRAAKASLTWWLKGIFSVTSGRDYFGEYDYQEHCEPQVHRNAQNMEIVKFKLTIIPE